MINRVLRLILFLFVIGAETLHASTPLDIVSSFGKTLSKWCQTDDINCRKSLEKMCSGVKKCRVEDKVLADYLFKKGQFDHDVPYIYEHHFSFDNGLAIVSKDGKIGLIDVYGNSSF